MLVGEKEKERKGKAEKKWRRSIGEQLKLHERGEV